MISRCLTLAILTAPALGCHKKPVKFLPLEFRDCQTIQAANGKSSCSCPHPVVIGIDAKSHTNIVECVPKESK